MILAIDIGNTTVSIGVLKGRRVVQINSVDAGMSQTQFNRDFAKIGKTGLLFLRLKSCFVSLEV